MNGDLMAAEMAAQPRVLARLAVRAQADREATRAIVPRPLAGTVFLARGSSDNAAVLGRYLAELWSGRPAGLAAPSLYTRYHASVDWRGYLVVALSQSGATPEIIMTCRQLRAAGAVVVGITNEPRSPLADTVDMLLSTDAGTERAVPATKTVTAQLALLITVAAALGAEASGRDRTGNGTGTGTEPADGGTGSGTRTTAGERTAAGTRRRPAAGGELPPPMTVREQLEAASAAAAQVLADPEPAARLAARWRGLDRLVVAGRGLAYAAARETALKVQETTGILAEGLSVADLLHGPIAAVHAGAPVLLVDGGGPAAADVAELRALLARQDAEAERMPVPPGLPETARVIAEVVRGQQLARELALARGADPDAPAHLSKVTLTS